MFDIQMKCNPLLQMFDLLIIIFTFVIKIYNFYQSSKVTKCQSQFLCKPEVDRHMLLTVIRTFHNLVCQGFRIKL